MDDLIKSLKAQLYDRATSPLLASFLISWVAWNHRLILVVISDMKLLEKFAYIDTVLYPTWGGFGPALVFPLLSTAFLIFIYPVPARFVYGYARNEQKRLKEIQQLIDDETPMTKDEARALRTELRAAGEKFDREVSTRDSVIVHLRGELATMHAQREKTPKSGDANLPDTDTTRRVLTDPQNEILSIIANNSTTGESALKDQIGSDLLKLNYNLDELERLGFITVGFGASGTRFFKSTPAGRAHLMNVTVSVVES